MLTEHWNGAAWSSVTVSSPACDVFESSCQLTGVSADSASDVIAVGNGILNTSPTWTTAPLAFRWNGSAWSALTLPAPGYHNRQFTSVIMHYNGSAWTQAAVGDNSGLLDVDALSPADAWALAADGSVLNWDGSTWTAKTQLASGNTVLTALSATDVWVGGVVSVTHYNGSSWSTAPIPAGISGLAGAASSGPGNVWFAGDNVTSSGVTEPVVLSTSNG
jgi:hypothetical protein